MSSKKLGKTYTISVVGLSGYDIQEKQLYSIGKSCLCNRLIQPAQDEYNTDHTSIFSTSDFVGSVLNSDHFLYWGTIDKTVDKGEVKFRIIEHTELIDDSSYAPLSKGGELVPYTKRATATKLVSPGKMMYISRDQVALQSEFEEKSMDEKVQVDAFICVYDVSITKPRGTNHLDLQEEVLSILLSYISKSKKPVIIVATKCDKTEEQILQRAHNYVNTKKLTVPLIESSADLFVNIDCIFPIIWHLLDSKHKSKPKILSYQESLQQRKELISTLDRKYLDLIKSAATNSSLLMSWNDFKDLKGNFDVFQDYVKTCGSDKASFMFNQQAKKIKRHYEDKKLNEFLNKLPDALDELLPTIQSIEANDWKWENCQKAIKNHLLFDKWFQILPQGISWNCPGQLFKTSERIPFDVLQVERSRACFDRHYKKLRESAIKIRMKNEFRKLLELTVEIRPGTSWPDALILICHEEPYKYLDESERKYIFETYLREITFKAKTDFQELLFESASKFSKLSKESRPSEAELREIYEHLQHDERYKNLENLDNSRDILLFNHLALMQSSNRCLSGPEKCMDRLIQQVVEMTERRTGENPYENEIFRDHEDELINLLVIGKNGLGRELEEKIRIESSSCEDLEYMIDGQIYGLNIKVHDVSDKTTTVAPDTGVKSIISDFKPQGYLAIYSTPDSLRYIKECLKQIEEYESLTHTALPLIVLLGNEAGTPDSEIQYLRNEGNNLANSLQCIFIDYPYTVSLMDDRIHSSQVEDSLRGIFDVINKRSRPSGTHGGYDDNDSDVKILLCAMCGDEYSVELILSSMLQQNNCYSNPDKQDTILLEAIIDGTKKTISVTLGSYHRAYSQKSQIFHGYIMVYSAKRLASLETLKAFASTIPRHVPVQVLAVTGSSSGASIIFHDPKAKYLLNDDSKLSTKLLQQQTVLNQAGAFLNFFGDVVDKKSTTELILNGRKKRRLQEPLPEIPDNQLDVSFLNDDIDDTGIYTSIKDSPYIDVAVSRSYLESDDSVLSSPDRKGSFRTRASTCDSQEDALLDTSHDQKHDEGYVGEIPHDPSGLYAQVDKSKKFSYLTKLTQKASSEEDDDDVVWTENAAYQAGPSDEQMHSKTPIVSDRPYATVSYLPKDHKNVPHDHNKFATIPLPRTRSEGVEPEYVDINLLRNALRETSLGAMDQETNSVSSKSKGSTASTPETQEKSPFPSPSMPRVGTDGKTTWYLGDTTEPQKNVAPLAKREEDDDVSGLRLKLEDVLPSTRTLTKKDSITSSCKESTPLRKSRSESNHSTSSLDPRNLVFRLKSKISPNPSPVNSDAEQDAVLETPTTPKKKSGLTKSMRKRKESPGQPVIKVEDADIVKERSNTLPIERPTESPKQRLKFGSLEPKNKSKSFLKKHLSSDGVSYGSIHSGSQTLDRNRLKKKKHDSKSKLSKDDLDLTLGGESTEKKKKPLSIRLKSGKPKMPKKRDMSFQMKAAQWDRKNKQLNIKDDSYFGKALNDIVPAKDACPVFIEKAIKHVEAYGMQSEGIYRLSGNKHDIEAIMTKFSADPNINLHELGVSVHAVTGAMKSFFKLLPDPLVPESFGKEINETMIIMDAEERMNKLADLINQLPPVNHAIFLKLMCHLHRISQYKNTNKMDARNLQVVLYPTLLRPEFQSLSNMSKNMNMGLFVQTCIEQAERFFGAENVNSMPTNMVEAPSTSSLSQILDDSTVSIPENRLSSVSFINGFTGAEGSVTSTDGGAQIIDENPYETIRDGPSLSETVLSDPSVESALNLPKSDLSSNLYQTKTTYSKNSDKRKSMETMI